MLAGACAGLAAAAIGAVLLRRRERSRDSSLAAAGPTLAPPSANGDRLGGRAGPV